MGKAALLAKEKVISISALQKNPSKALDADIVRITKNGQEIGIYLSKEEFQDLLEEQMMLSKDFQDELETAISAKEKRHLSI